jgi:hypothetical protein
LGNCSHHMKHDRRHERVPRLGYLKQVGSEDDERTPEDYFDGFPEGLALYKAVEDAIATIGQATVRVTKSQIAFRRRKGFAYVWRPGQHVKSEVPAVLSIALPREVASKRFKSVVHPSIKVWMHHIELNMPAQIDDEVREWLTEAYDNAS